MSQPDLYWIPPDNLTYQELTSCLGPTLLFGSHKQLERFCPFPSLGSFLTVGNRSWRRSGSRGEALHRHIGLSEARIPI